jgi:hypothetical protein
MMNKTRKVFECECGDTNHLLVVNHWPLEEDGWEDFYIEVQAHYYKVCLESRTKCLFLEWYKSGSRGG